MSGTENSPSGLADADAELRGTARTDALISLLRLNWFIRLRWGIVCAALAVLSGEYLVAAGPKRPVQLAAVLAVLALVNVIWTGLSRFLHGRLEISSEADEKRATRIALVHANAQVAVDILLLTLILRYTGGVESPITIFYLFHMAIGSLILRTWQALLQGTWAMLLFVVLGVGELHGWITPHFPLLPSMQELGLYKRPEYVISAFAVLACGVLGMLYFTLHIVGELDDRERQLRRVVAALRQSQTAIADLQLRRSRFMQTAAHQLKTPLAVIQTLAGLICDEVVQGPAVRDTSKKIVFRCREGITQVTELLTLARLQEADAGRQTAEPIDAGGIILDLCHKSSPLAEGKQIELTYHVPEQDDLLVEVPANDLRDCIANLIDNAIKFTFGPGKVTVTAGRCSINRPPSDIGSRTKAPGPSADDCVFVAVADTGIGIDPATLRGRDGPGGEGSIFDAFRRGNQALAAGIAGTGLGLSIVREVVEQAGGRIHVQSALGGGSTFTLIFPSRRPVLAGIPVRDTRVSQIVIDGAGTEQAKPAAAGEGPACT